MSAFKVGGIKLKYKRRTHTGPSFWVGGACDFGILVSSTHAAKPLTTAKACPSGQASSLMSSACKTCEYQKPLCVVQLQRPTEPHLSHAPPDDNMCRKLNFYTKIREWENIPDTKSINNILADPIPFSLGVQCNWLLN